MSNIKEIQHLIEYIEEHITEELDIETLMKVSGYSKYHLSRLFSSIVGFSIHQYIIRRKLTEAAKSLIFTEKLIIDIALESGYESQQAFAFAFKKMYKQSPQRFRLKHKFHPLQLKFDVSGKMDNLKGDRIIDIEMVEKEELRFVGFKANTENGFFVIPRLWHKLHKWKNQIKSRTNMDYVIGINEYSGDSICMSKQPAFDYYAAVEVNEFSEVPSGMSVMTLPAGKYMMFVYYGRSKDSMQPVMDYIYKAWFPQSNCKLNENARVDMIRYGEKIDDKGNSRIEVLVPILS